MPDAERIAQLQRLAFGPAASDAERAAARAELADVLRPVAAASPAGDRATDPAGNDRQAPRPTTSERGSGPPAAHRHPAAVLLAGGAALAVGLLAGWGAAATAPDRSLPGASSGAQAAPESTSGAGDLPFDEAPAMDVFDREQVASDRTPIADDRLWIDRPTQRRLLTLPDGTAVTALRTVDGGDVCLAIERPRQGGGSTCLQNRGFPASGLTLDVVLGGTGYGVVWKPTGELDVTYRPAR